MLLVTALFTENTGDPATGLTLADIDLYLYSRKKSDGSVSTIWNGETPTEEIGGGKYSKSYGGEDFDTYDYFAHAHYTGATSLDSNYSLDNSFGLGAPEVNAEVLDVIQTDTHGELGSVPAATSSIIDKLNWLFMLARNKIEQTSSTQTLRADDGATEVASASVSDDGTTATRGEFS